MMQQNFKVDTTVFWDPWREGREQVPLYVPFQLIFFWAKKD